MVDRVDSGSLYSYTDLVSRSKEKEKEDTNIFDKKSNPNTLIPDQYQITNAIKSQIAGFEEKLNTFQEEISTLASENNAYSSIEESLNNMSDLQQKYASGDYTEKERADMQSQFDRELENIQNTIDQAKEDGVNVQVDDNLQDVIDSEISIEGNDRDMLSYAVDEVGFRQKSVRSRIETAEEGLERVQKRYDEAVDAKNTVQNMSDARQMLDNIANQMTGAGSYDFFSISRDTVDILLNI